MEKEILVQFRVPAKGKMKSLNVICFPMFRSSRPGVFLGKGVQKTSSKFAGEHPFRSLISIKLQSDFIEMTLQNGRSPVNLLHIFRTAFPKNTSKLGSCFRMFPKLYEGFYNIIPFSVKKLIIIVTNQIFSKVSKSDYGTPIKVKKMLQTIGKFFLFSFCFITDLVTFTEELINGQLHFLCSVRREIWRQSRSNRFPVTYWYCSVNLLLLSM